MKILDKMIPTLWGDGKPDTLGWKTYVEAEGAWVGDNYNIGSPLNTAKVKCFKSSMVCISAQANLTRTFRLHVMNVNFDVLDIERWDDHEIVTKPYGGSDGECTRYIIRISKRLERVTMLRSTIKDEGTCRGAEQKDLHSTLSNGHEVHIDLSDKHHQKVISLYKFDGAVLE